MAYVVPRPGDLWDIRESRTTAAGPRSYTLASFKTLTPEVLARAQERAGKPFDGEQLREKALRAGAAVEPSAADRSAAELLVQLSAGRQPRPALKALVLDALRDGGQAAGDNARAAAAWIGATPKQRGEALVDLLVLADKLPRRARRERERFPRIESRTA